MAGFTTNNNYGIQSILYLEKQWILMVLVEKPASFTIMGLVKHYSDLHELTVGRYLPLDRMAQKSAENLVKRC
jgi:hypothetical protein